MSRYLITHSLLASWLWAMSENPYEDLTTENDPMEEFMTVLRREPTPTSEAMQNGINFEDMVTRIVTGHSSPDDLQDKWIDAAKQVAGFVKGGRLQFKASRKARINGMDFVLYGRLDALKAGEIMDIKFSKSYDRGKYFDSTQHPMYMELIPEAREFSYIISNGRDVWTETYRRDETRSICPIISDFVDWLNAVDLMPVYQEHWGSK